MKKGKFYIGWGWGTDCTIESTIECFDTYEQALKEAIKSHKDEIRYQKNECGARKGDEIINNYVVFYDGNEYIMAVVSGWNCAIEEYEYKEE